MVLACWIGPSPDRPDSEDEADADADADSDTDADADGDADSDADSDPRWLEGEVLASSPRLASGQGLARATVADLNGDGVGDLVLGAPLAGGGRGLLWTLPGPLDAADLDVQANAQLANGERIAETTGRADSGLGAELYTAGGQVVAMGYEDFTATVYLFGTLPAGDADQVWSGRFEVDHGTTAFRPVLNVGSDRWLLTSPPANVVYVSQGPVTGTADAGALLQVKAPGGTLVDNGPGDATAVVRDGEPTVFLNIQDGGGNTALWNTTTLQEGLNYLDDASQLTGVSALWSPGDIDGDGQQDLVAALSEERGTLGVFTTLPYDDTTTALQDAPLLITTNQPWGLGGEVHRVGDLDGDGADELWLATVDGRALLIWGGPALESGGTTGLLEQGQAVNVSCQEASCGAVVGGGGDLDGDGRPDLILGDGDQAVWLLLSAP